MKELINDSSLDSSRHYRHYRGNSLLDGLAATMMTEGKLCSGCGHTIGAHCSECGRELCCGEIAVKCPRERCLEKILPEKWMDLSGDYGIEQPNMII